MWSELLLTMKHTQALFTFIVLTSINQSTKIYLNKSKKWLQSRVCMHVQLYIHVQHASTNDNYDISSATYRRSSLCLWYDNREWKYCDNNYRIIDISPNSLVCSWVEPWNNIIQELQYTASPTLLPHSTVEICLEEKNLTASARSWPLQKLERN